MESLKRVATALTVYGIETTSYLTLEFLLASSLQQPLPFTVLKPASLASLKASFSSPVATALTVYGIETIQEFFI